MGTITLKEIAKMIDHSLLHPTMTDSEIKAGCELAKKYDVATACVKPYAIPLAGEILQGSDVDVCAVIGFPHGNSTIDIKVKEAAVAVVAGAPEIDMVVNIGKVLGDAWEYVSEEIKAVNDVIIANKAILKVIFENDYLQNRHIIQLCEICSQHRVAFVKTSTGYGFVKQNNGMYAYQGATDHHLKLMAAHCAKGVQIKAAGGVRTLDDLLRVRALGVTRVGASATESIMEEAISRGYR
jgi:deoxyribose-phosphate aldolase